jgi:hypothetical protein
MVTFAPNSPCCLGYRKADSRCAAKDQDILVSELRAIFSRLSSGHHQVDCQVKSIKEIADLS